MDGKIKRYNQPQRQLGLELSIDRMSRISTNNDLGPFILNEYVQGTYLYDPLTLSKMDRMDKIHNSLDRISQLDNVSVFTPEQQKLTQAQDTITQAQHTLTQTQNTLTQTQHTLTQAQLAHTHQLPGTAAPTSDTVSPVAPITSHFDHLPRPRKPRNMKNLLLNLSSPLVSSPSLASGSPGITSPVGASPGISTSPLGRTFSTKTTVLTGNTNSPSIFMRVEHAQNGLIAEQAANPAYADGLPGATHPDLGQLGHPGQSQSVPPFNKPWVRKLTLAIPPEEENQLRSPLVLTKWGLVSRDSLSGDLVSDDRASKETLSERISRDNISNDRISHDLSPQAEETLSRGYTPPDQSQFIESSQTGNGTFIAKTKTRAIAREVVLSFPEELQESNQTNAYPLGPRNVFNSQIFLFSDPNPDSVNRIADTSKVDINKFDLIINVAKECLDMSSLHHGEYIHLKWLHTSAISSDLLWLIRKIDDYYESGRTILVHCQCGVSRSACVVVAYFMFKFEVGVNDAYEMLKGGVPVTKSSIHKGESKSQNNGLGGSRGSGERGYNLGGQDNPTHTLGEETVAKLDGHVIEACDRICPNMSLIFELMEFAEISRTVSVVAMSDATVSESEPFLMSRS